MRLKLFVSNTENSASSRTIADIARNVNASEQNIIIVPDSYSLSIEQEVHQILGIIGSFNIDVVSFTRLAIKELKGKAKKCLSKEGAVIVLKQVIDRNVDKLTHYRAVASLNGFPKEMFAVIASIRNSGYTVEEIESASEGLIKSTKSKAHDIALLYREYVEELATNYEDSTTRIEKFIACAGESERLKNSNVYIVGFNTFTGKQYAVIAALLRTCLSVNIAVVPTNNGANCELYPSETYERLRDLAQENSIKTEIYESYKVLKEPFSTLNKELFAVSEAQVTDSENRIRLYRESSVYDEINGVACEICRLVNRENYRYKDIAVINAGADTNELIKSIFKRYDIPYFIDTKYPLSGTIVARFLLDVINMLNCNFKMEKTLAVIKAPLFGLTIAEQELFENYILKYNISYNNFLEPLKWGDQKEELEQVRIKIASLAKFFPHNASASDYALACKNLLTQYDAENRIEAYLATLNDELILATNEQGLTRVMALCEELARLLSGAELSLDKFYDYLSDTIGADEISLIPQFLDSVFIGGLRDSRLNDTKVAFLTGASAENLPAPHNYQAIISPLDAEMLEVSGIRLYPTPVDLIREDECAIAELFTKISDFIYIGYSEVACDGAINAPSVVITDIINICNKKCESLAKRYALENCATLEQLEDSAVTPENAYFEYLKYANKDPETYNKVASAITSLYKALDDEQQEAAERLFTRQDERYIGRPEQYFKLAGDNKYLSKITEIEQYYRCPYFHHLTYGLKLREREVSEIRLVDVGNILHRIFELYFGATIDKLDTLTSAELSAICEQAIAKAIGEFSVNGGEISLMSQNMLNNIAREARIATKILTQNILNSNYRPKYVEMTFGTGERPMIPFKVDDNEFLFRGKIDRVDICRDKVVIVDYKTGTADGSLKGLYFGTKLQLYIYLGVLTDEGYRAGGVFYLQVKDTYSKNSKAYVLDGQMLFEEENLDDAIKTARKEAQNSGLSTYYCSGIDAVLSVKKGEAQLKYNKKTATAEQFELYKGYAKTMVTNALAEISAGSIAKSPLDGCGGCVYKPICGELAEEDIRKEASVRPYDAKECEEEGEN